MAEGCETVITLGYCPFSGMVNMCQFRTPKAGGHSYKSLARGYSQQLIHSFININKTLCPQNINSNCSKDLRMAPTVELEEYQLGVGCLVMPEKIIAQKKKSKYILIKAPRLFWL